MKPTSRFLALILVWLLLGIAVHYFAALAQVWNGFGLVLAVSMLVDLNLVRTCRNFVAQRQLNSNLPVGNWSRVKLTIENLNQWPVQLSVFDHLPSGFEVENQPLQLHILRGKCVDCTYSIKPLVRGDEYFKGTQLLIRSPMGLWDQKHFIDNATSVKVYPNFTAISRYALLAADNRLSQMGVKRRRRRGEGLEFRQLREYRSGDSLRRVDWKATVRQGKLISREYEDERDQHVIFLLDCGRRMRVVEDGQAHMDLTLNAMLLLAYVAIRQGDSVGFLAFAGQDRWVAPRKGSNIVNYLLNQCYALDSTTHAPDYLQTADRLMQLHSKRSMVMILSNTRGEEQPELVKAIELLRLRHLVVMADIKEPGLHETMDRRVTDFDSALDYQSVYAYLQRRRHFHESLQHLGAICLDTTALDLPLKLVNQYLDIKDSGRL